MVGSASGPGSTFKAFLGSARVRVPLSNKIRVRVGSVQHIYGSLRVRVRILGPVKTSTSYFFLLTSLMEMLISFSSRAWHLTTLPKVPKAGSMTMVFTVLDWLANSPDLNPMENLWGIVKRKMGDTRPNMQMTRRLLSKQPGLPLHLSSATGCLPPCHNRIDAVIHAKGGPTKY